MAIYNLSILSKHLFPFARYRHHPVNAFHTLAAIWHLKYKYIIICTLRYFGNFLRRMYKGPEQSLMNGIHLTRLVTYYAVYFSILVPMDLDSKMKATALGAVFLIVS